MNNKLYNKIEKFIKKAKTTLISEKIKYQGNFIKLYEEKHLLPNNKTVTKERITKNNNKQSVIIIAITKDNNYILVVQNRINNITSIEFPSGYIEKNETIKEAATRELMEETGYYSDDIEILDNYYPQISIDNSVVNIVIAYNCQKKEKQNLSSNEYLFYEEFTKEELTELINDNYIKSGGNKLAFYIYNNTTKKKY